MEPWLRGLGVVPGDRVVGYLPNTRVPVVADQDARRAWLEPHLWAALRARIDATTAERQARWTQPATR